MNLEAHFMNVGVRLRSPQPTIYLNLPPQHSLLANVHTIFTVHRNRRQQWSHYPNRWVTTRVGRNDETMNATNHEPVG